MYVIVAENRIFFRKTEKQMRATVFDLMNAFGKDIEFAVEQKGEEIPREQLGLYAGSVSCGDNYRKEYRGMARTSARR